MTAHVPLPNPLNVSAIIELTGAATRSASISGGELYISGITQEVLDDAMVIYYGDPETYVLSPARTGRSSRFSSQAYSFISDRYSVQVQQLFQALLTEASIDGLANRIVYIKQLLDWAKSITAVTLVADDELAAATSMPEIEAVTIDLTPFEATDPEITIKEAMEIVD